MAMENNTMVGCHVWGKKKNGELRVNTGKMYCWHIPKKIRDTPIEKGDTVLVQTKRGKKPVLVADVFREENKEIKKKYKKVIKLIEKLTMPRPYWH